MTNDEADDRYGSVNIAENDSSRLAGVKLSAVITRQTECYTWDRESRSRSNFCDWSSILLLNNYFRTALSMA